MKIQTALLVDDSPSARRIFQNLLEQAGLRVATAASAEEALGYLEALLPDVIFMDHLMRGMDGLEAAAEIARRPSTAGIPVVLLTSSLTPAFLEDARRHGAWTALPKRSDPTLIHSVLEDLCNCPASGPETSHGAAASAQAPSCLPGDYVLAEGEAERLAADLGNLIGQAFAPVADLVLEQVRSEVLFRALHALEAARPQLTEAVRAMVEEIVHEALAEQAGEPPVSRIRRLAEERPELSEQAARLRHTALGGSG